MPNRRKVRVFNARFSGPTPTSARRISGPLQNRSPARGRQGWPAWPADHALLLLTYRHGLRVSEAVGLKLDHVNLKEARIWVKRVKGSLDSRAAACRRRAQGAEVLPRDPRGQAALVVRVRARLSDGPPGRQSHDRCGRQARGSGQRPSAHAAPLLRLRSRQQGPRLPVDPGLARASRSQAHQQIHKGGCQAVRWGVGLNAVIAADHRGGSFTRCHELTGISSQAGRLQLPCRLPAS